MTAQPMPRYAPAYFVAALVPIVGVLLAIVALARNDIGPGLAILLLSVLSFFVWAALLAA